MNVKKRIAVIAALTAGAVLAAGYPVALRNAGFHETDGKGGAVGWSAHPNWHAEAAGHNGSGGIVWECASEAESKKGGPCQTVALKPGRRYDFSALVKTENVVTERKSPHQGIGPVVRYYDADGKSMFSDWSTPLANGTSGDWIAVKGITREVPGGVASISFGISTMKCVSGRAVVDNMFIAEHDTPTVAGVFPHVYRCEATGGEVVFSASLNADVCENALSDYTATFAYVAADGRRASVAGKVVSAVEAMATLDVSRFAAGTNDVVCTLFLKGREVGTASVPFAHLEKPMPRRVFIDRHHRTIVDGKPFFPLGMCYWRKFAKDELDRYAEGPFNCLNSGLGATREDLDLCRERGLMAICRLDSRFDEPDGGLSWLKSEVDALKSHTAVLGWFVSDELPLSYVPMLRRRQSWMEAHDPDHPTWFANDRVHEARSYLGVADVIGVDPYPIPAGRIGIVNETVRAAEVNTLGTMAQWVFPQAFAWGWLNRRETKGQRAPTRKEMANMGWQAIAGGANGLIFYAYQHILEQPHDDPADAFEPAWERTKAMGGEFRKYLDVFLSVDPVPEAKSSNAAVAVRTWRYKGDVYLLAVNCTTDAQTAEISLAEPVRRVVSADFAAVPGVEGGRVRISLGPIDYVMAKLETAGAAASGAGAWKVPKWTTVVTEAGAVQNGLARRTADIARGCASARTPSTSRFTTRSSRPTGTGGS